MHYGVEVMSYGLVAPASLSCGIECGLSLLVTEKQ